jgi:hypothetical protein
MYDVPHAPVEQADCWRGHAGGGQRHQQQHGEHARRQDALQCTKGTTAVEGNVAGVKDWPVGGGECREQQHREHARRQNALHSRSAVRRARQASVFVGVFCWL